MLRRWASVLDALVWLDAADLTLVGRINYRAKGHLVKQAPSRMQRCG